MSYGVIMCVHNCVSVPRTCRICSALWSECSGCTVQVSSWFKRRRIAAQSGIRRIRRYKRATIRCRDWIANSLHVRRCRRLLAPPVSSKFHERLCLIRIRHPCSVCRRGTVIWGKRGRRHSEPLFAVSYDEYCH